MKVAIMPSLDCNYKCEYCYLQGRKTKPITDSFKSVEDHDSTEWIEGLRWLGKVWKRIVSIDVSGGEPFLYPHMVELAQKIIEEYGKINITSNLALLPDEFFSLNHYKIGLTVSAHLDENGKLRRDFIEKMIKLRTRGFSFSINFVAYPKQIKKFDKIINIAKTLNMGCHLEPYVDYNTEPTDFGGFYNPDDEQYFYDNMNQYDARAVFDAKARGTKKIECNVASKYLVVVENGDVFPCFGFLFENKFKLGNIFKRELFPLYEKFKIVPIECELFCPCANNFRDGIR